MKTDTYRNHHSYDSMSAEKIISSLTLPQKAMQTVQPADVLQLR